MSTGVKVVAALLVGVLAGGGAGVFAGAKLGTSLIVGNWVRTDANNADETIEILEQLRAEQPAEALEGLETHLNRHLFGLMPSSLEQVRLPNATLAQALRTKQLAQGYRRANPRPAVTALDRDIEMFLFEISSGER